MRRRRKIVPPKNIWSRIERGIIKMVVLGAVFLVLVQMVLGLAKDPVEFYMSVATKIGETDVSKYPSAVDNPSPCRRLYPSSTVKKISPHSGPFVPNTTASLLRIASPITRFPVFGSL